MGWGESNIPDLSGKVFVVTGGNSGIGWEASRALAAKGARVIIACRNEAKGREAADRILALVPNAQVEVGRLDLAHLGSVAEFAAGILKDVPQLHGLLNNAGVMALPFAKTGEGLEMQMGTNHFGHFALTGRLMPMLEATPGSRVVTVSSIMHRRATFDFDNLQGEKGYQPWIAYGMSKLANLLFTYELERRLKAKGAAVSALACHPGYAATNLQFVGPQMSGARFREYLMNIGNVVVAQSAAKGALPTLFAATDPEARGGQYIGPGGLMEMRGAPRVVNSNAESKREDNSRRLWALSEQVTGVAFLS